MNFLYKCSLDSSWKCLKVYLALIGIYLNNMICEINAWSDWAFACFYFLRILDVLNCDIDFNELLINYYILDILATSLMTKNWKKSFTLFAFIWL